MDSDEEIQAMASMPPRKRSREPARKDVSIFLVKSWKKYVVLFRIHRQDLPQWLNTQSGDRQPSIQDPQEAELRRVGQEHQTGRVAG